MPSADQNDFETAFGYSVPEDVVRLYSDDAIRNMLPVEFRFSRVDFILDIQFLLSLEDSQNYDVGNERLYFAVNSDGNKLLIDLGTEALQVMQEEFGDIDYLGLTVRDLLEADKKPAS